MPITPPKGVAQADAARTCAARVLTHAFNVYRCAIIDFANRHPVDWAEVHRDAVDVAHEVVTEFEADIRREHRPDAD